MEVMLEAKSSNSNSRLQLTTKRKGVLWIDQVSAMPTDTYKVDTNIPINCINLVGPVSGFDDFRLGPV